MPQKKKKEKNKRQISVIVRKINKNQLLIRAGMIFLIESFIKKKFYEIYADL